MVSSVSSVSFLTLTVLGLCYAQPFSFCKFGEKGADKCLAKNMEIAIKSLPSGNAEYGMPPLDPISIDKLTIDAGSSVKLTQNYKNIKLHGTTDLTITKAHYDPQKKTLLFQAQVPNITQIGEYNVNGQLLSIPVTGDGPSTLILENVAMLINIQFEEIQKQGQTYCRIKTYDLHMTPDRMRLNFENLFNGNKLLGDNINKLINEEWAALYSDVQPQTEQNYANVYKNYANIFFDKVPCHVIFPKQ